VTASRYDVVIAGAGIAGATLAATLAGSRFRVALVDGSAPANPDPQGYDLRVSAVTRGSEKIFRAVGAWERMVAARVSPFREMQVWDAGGSGAIHFDSAELGEACLGHIVENRVIVQALIDIAAAADNVDLYIPVAVEEVRDAEAELTVALADGRNLSARLLVAADGARSPLRRHAGIESRGWSYHQQGIVATVRTALSHRETAWQRFLSTGPLAFLPLADGRCSIVWSNDDPRARELLALDDAEFAAELEQAFESRLGAILELGRRAAFPLGVANAERYSDHRLVLVGDAAHRIHPLAGQGANLGVTDAAVLAELLYEVPEDPGHPALLQRYGRRRKGDVLATAATMDAFKRLFGARQPVLQLLRNTGLSLADRAGPMKQMVMEHAMGLAGDRPQLAHALNRYRSGPI